MNVLEKAADVLEQGWCRAALIKHEDDRDTHCALGAIAAVEFGLTWDEIQEHGDEHFYHMLSRSKAVEVLAKTIDEKSGLSEDEDDFVSIVYNFNDAHNAKDPVIKMMRKAAKNYDEES